MQSVRARVPRRRAMRARVGVLEDVRRAAGEGLARGMAMNQLGNGLSAAGHHEDALSVREAELAMDAAPWRIRNNILVVQSHLLPARIKCSDGTKRPCACGGRCTRDV